MGNLEDEGTAWSRTVWNSRKVFNNTYVYIYTHIHTGPSRTESVTQEHHCTYYTCADIADCKCDSYIYIYYYIYTILYTEYCMFHTVSMPQSCSCITSCSKNLLFINAGLITSCLFNNAGVPPKSDKLLIKGDPHLNNMGVCQSWVNVTYIHHCWRYSCNHQYKRHDRSQNRGRAAGRWAEDAVGIDDCWGLISMSMEVMQKYS